MIVRIGIQRSDTDDDPQVAANVQAARVAMARLLYPAAMLSTGESTTWAVDTEGDPNAEDVAAGRVSGDALPDGALPSYDDEWYGEFDADEWARRTATERGWA